MKANLRELLPEAVENHRAVAGFNIFGLDEAVRVVAAAESLGEPVILMTNKELVRSIPVEVLGPALVRVAEGSSVPVCVHLDHTYEMDTIHRAIEAGYTSVMYDGSQKEFDPNAAETAAVAEVAHRRGVSVEGEIGSVAYNERESAIKHELTSPEEAARFAAATGVDVLAVSVGTVHKLLEQSAAVDHELLARIREATEVPLVIHGTSGVPEGDLRRMALSGVAKFNIGTLLRRAWGETLRGEMRQRPELFDRLTLTAAPLEAIAMAQGYELNAIARGLATSSVGTIGVILPENYDRFDVLLYHGALHNNLRKSLERADLDVIVAFKKNRFSGRNNIEKLVTRKKIDGLIIVQSELEPETVRFLKSREIPFVLTHYPPKESNPGYHVVYSDNWTGGKLMAEHLADRGFGSILCISGGEERQSAERVAGFTESLRSRGIELREEQVLRGDWTSESAARLVKEEMQLFREADALFAANDLMAFGAMQALQRAGLRVPEDIAVAGYDDTPLAESTIPALTTVHQAQEEIALLASQLLFDLIARNAESGNPEEMLPRTVAIQPRLVVRESTKSLHRGGGNEDS